jgi:hypothetical protein
LKKNPDLESRTNIPDPQHWFKNKRFAQINNIKLVRQSLQAVWCYERELRQKSKNLSNFCRHSAKSHEKHFTDPVPNMYTCTNLSLSAVWHGGKKMTDDIVFETIFANSRGVYRSVFDICFHRPPKQIILNSRIQ